MSPVFVHFMIISLISFYCAKNGQFLPVVNIKELEWRLKQKEIKSFEKYDSELLNYLNF